jgi:hypothetical protein
VPFCRLVVAVLHVYRIPREGLEHVCTLGQVRRRKRPGNVTLIHKGCNSLCFINSFKSFVFRRLIEFLFLLEIGCCTFRSSNV